jgi:hypothetical protein
MKIDTEMESLTEKIEKARGLIAVIWEENADAMKELSAPGVKEETKFSTEDHSPLVISVAMVNQRMDLLLEDIDRLREAIDL